jgi:hypothetical protein
MTFFLSVERKSRLDFCDVSVVTVRKGEMTFFLSVERKVPLGPFATYQISPIETMGKGGRCQELRRKLYTVTEVISAVNFRDKLFALIGWLITASWKFSGQKKSRIAGRVKEGRKGLPLPATGDEKGAFDVVYSNLRANLFK